MENSKKIGRNVPCQICNEEFYVRPSLEKQKQTCSKKCFKVWRSIQAKKKGYGLWMIGKKLSAETKQKLSLNCKKRNSIKYIKEYIKKNGAWNKGIKHTTQHKDNLKKAKEKEKERIYMRNGRYMPCNSCGKLAYFGNSLKTKPYCSKKCSPITKTTCKDSEIINAFINSGMTLKDIYKKYHCSRVCCKKILLKAGILEIDIRRLANKKIGANTKKHRKFQIFPKTDTSIEVKIQNFLKELNIEFLTHQHMNIRDSYQCDIFIPSIKLVIECDGDYWHGNLETYNNWNNLSQKQKVQKIRDYGRTNELEEKGFKVWRLWEKDIKKINLPEFKHELEIKNGT